MNIFITGAGQGLGACLTFLALHRGHTVYAAVHSLTRIAGEFREYQKHFDTSLHLCEMDVTDAASVKRAADYVEEHGGSLDAVINNAAIMIERDQTIDKLDLSTVSRSFEVNTIGPMRVIQTLLPQIYKGSSQVIVNISSEAGTIINAFETNYQYSMSKTALNMFSERLWEYLKPKDIRVYAVHPGWMRTNMGGIDAPANPEDIANGILDILERKKKIYSKIAFIDSTGRPMPL